MRYPTSSLDEQLKGQPEKRPAILGDSSWFDRTKEFAARNRGEDFGRMTYATRRLSSFRLYPAGRISPHMTIGNGWPIWSRRSRATRQPPSPQAAVCQPRIA
jgi:hypothetical protein